MDLKAVLAKKAASHTLIKVDAPVTSKVSGKANLASALKKRTADRKKAEDPANIAKVFETGLVPIWSFSELKNFETCPYRTYLNKVEKIKQKEQEPDVGADRGSKIHDHCEDFVRGNVDTLLPNLSGKRWKAEGFQHRFDDLRNLFVEGKVECEEDWGVRKDWSPCTWKDKQLWGRAKLDVFVRESDTSCRIIDHKTGMKFGNEVKHGDQGLSYGIGAMNRFPEIQHFNVEFWYLDHNMVMNKRFTRRMLEKFMPRYHNRAMALTTATKAQFIAKPSIDNCKWCPFGSGKFGNGHCQKDYCKV